MLAVLPDILAGVHGYPLAQLSVPISEWYCVAELGLVMFSSFESLRVLKLGYFLSSMVICELVVGLVVYQCHCSLNAYTFKRCTHLTV